MFFFGTIDTADARLSAQRQRAASRQRAIAINTLQGA